MATLADGILSFLTPILGHGGAKRLLLSYCAKNNKQINELTQDDLTEMGKHLYKNLVIFVGNHRADQVIKMLTDNTH